MKEVNSSNPHVVTRILTQDKSGAHEILAIQMLYSQFVDKQT